MRLSTRKSCIEQIAVVYSVDMRYNTTEKTRKTPVIVFKASDQIKGMIERCIEALGCSQSELIRNLIIYKHEKMFPYYKVKGGAAGKLKPDPLTKAQICEMIGGRTVKKNGVECCRVGSTVSFTDTPLSEVDETWLPQD